MTDEQRKKRFERVCAECEECYYYWNCDTESECYGETEPCFEWQPKTKHIDKLTKKRHSF